MQEGAARKLEARVRQGDFDPVFLVSPMRDLLVLHEAEQYVFDVVSAAHGRGQRQAADAQGVLGKPVVHVAVRLARAADEARARSASTLLHRFFGGAAPCAACWRPAGHSV
jgi:hypothetical protein